MYHGRSIGRQIEWLRNYFPASADSIMFGGRDGAITLHGKVIAEGVDWDYFDNPIFNFTNRRDRVQQVIHFEKLRRREVGYIRMCVSDGDLELLRKLKSDGPDTSGRSRQDERVLRYKNLLDLGLAKKDDKLAGWDQCGDPIYDISIEIMPQGHGLLFMEDENAD